MGERLRKRVTSTLTVATCDTFNGDKLMNEIFVVEYQNALTWVNAYETKSLRSATETCEWYRNNGFAARIKSRMVNKWGQIIEENV